MLKGENQGPSDFENAREFESFENISDPEEGGDGQNHPERVPLLSIYFSSMTDVEEYVSGDEYIRVMPNPVINGEFTVYSQLLINSDITMVNSLGTTVKIFGNIASERMDVDIKELPSGIYYFNIIKDNTTYTQQIVKY
ncbi:MAG: hypothetical protein QG635_257, partial [Bacteroidota bacterium]|nr:hypothetical protein [Bacteroidota bacterium]